MFGSRVMAVTTHYPETMCPPDQPARMRPLFGWAVTCIISPSVSIHTCELEQVCGAMKFNLALDNAARIMLRYLKQKKGRYYE
jgi:hypothetical protein